MAGFFFYLICNPSIILKLLLTKKYVNLMLFISEIVSTLYSSSSLAYAPLTRIYVFTRHSFGTNWKYQRRRLLLYFFFSVDFLCAEPRLQGVRFLAQLSSLPSGCFLADQRILGLTQKVVSCLLLM